MSDEGFSDKSSWARNESPVFKSSSRFLKKDSKLLQKSHTLTSTEVYPKNAHSGRQLQYTGLTFVPETRTATRGGARSLVRAQTLPNTTMETTEFTKTRIYRAICRGDAVRLLKAIQKGGNVYQYNPANGMTYFHLLATFATSVTEDRFLPMVYQLSNSGLEPNVLDDRGRTPLTVAIHKELRQLTVAFIRIGTDLQDFDYKALIRSLHSPFQQALLEDYEYFEPGLWGAVRNRQVSEVHLLVNSWCRINTSKDGQSLIAYAKSLRTVSTDIIHTLEDFDITIEFVHAALAGDERLMLKYLMMEDGACDPCIMDISHCEGNFLRPRSLRDTVSTMGLNHVLHLIPERDAKSEDESDIDSGVQGHMVESDEETTKPLMVFPVRSNDPAVAATHVLTMRNGHQHMLVDSLAVDTPEEEPKPKKKEKTQFQYDLAYGTEAASETPVKPNKKKKSKSDLAPEPKHEEPERHRDTVPKKNKKPKKKKKNNKTKKDQKDGDEISKTCVVS